MNDDLMHYGIKGMRWGRRKTANATSKPGHADYERSRNLKKKDISKLSNKEIAELNQRLQLERQYRELTKKQKSKGREFAEGILKDVSREILKNALKDATKAAMAAAFKGVK